MAQGKPTKWARVEINQPLLLNKSGMTIIVRDKWGRRRRGRLIVSVGGLRWYPYMGKRATWRRTWEKLSEG